MLGLKTLAAASLLVLVASEAAMAQPVDRNPDQPGLGFGSGGSKDNVVGVPGPIAGLGLPMLAVAGGYIWFWRQRRKALDKQRD
jgi:hypothetical protein